MKDFYILFMEELMKMHSAGRHVIKALPYMIEQSSSNKLKDALKRHLNETLRQLARIEEIAAEFDQKLSTQENTSIKHILQEGKKTIHYCQDSETRDAAIIMNMQKIQHYEMASYGHLKTFAKHFKLNHIMGLLEESGKEEGRMDKKLSEIAEGTFFDSGINAKARKKCA